MNKEKEIEEMEMVESMKNACKKCCGSCAGCDLIKYGAFCQIAQLARAAISKADEVRKETAREILYFLKGYITDGLLKNHEILNALIEHYGVEVDE